MPGYTSGGTGIRDTQGRDACPDTHPEGWAYGIPKEGCMSEHACRGKGVWDRCMLVHASGGTDVQNSRPRDACPSTHPEARTYSIAYIGMHA
jgi:hypothetical protein